jgi:hypothetical protein
MNTEQNTHDDGRVETGVRKRKGRRIRRYSHAQREAFLVAFDQGSESQKNFCLSRGINLGTFKGWLQKRSKRSLPGFAQVEVALPKRASVEITLANGVRVSIEQYGKQSDLIALIRGVAGC